MAAQNTSLLLYYVVRYSDLALQYFFWEFMENVAFLWPGLFLASAGRGFLLQFSFLQLGLGSACHFGKYAVILDAIFFHRSESCRA